MTPREMFHRFFDLMNEGNREAATNLLHPDFYEDWPQSGERVRGATNLRAILDNYPGGLGANSLSDGQFHGREDSWVIAPNFTVIRVTDQQDTGTGVIKVRYPDSSEWWMIVLFEIKDDLIYRHTTFYAEPFDPPEWRAQWVEPIPG